MANTPISGLSSAVSVAGTDVVPSVQTAGVGPVKTSLSQIKTFVLGAGDTLPVANGGTGLTTLTAGYVPFGNGTSAFGSDASLVWDNTNKRLGTSGTTSFIFQTNSTERARIDGSSGNVGINCTPAATGKLAVNAVPSSAWQLDLSAGQSNYITLANNETYDLAGNASGLVMVQDNGGFCAGLLVAFFGQTAIIWQIGAGTISTTSGTANKINFYWTGSSYRFQNTSGSNKTIIISTIKTRNNT